MTVYDNSADVSLRGWASTDTLFFSITLTDPPTVKNPIVVGQDYLLDISLRHSASFPLNQVLFQLQMQQTDTTGGYVHPVRNIFREHLSYAVRDSLGQALGDTWGSLISCQEQMPELHVRFDSTGTYRFLIIPEMGEQMSVPGLASVGIRITSSR